IASALAVWTIAWQFAGTERMHVDHEGIVLTTSLGIPIRRRRYALSSIAGACLHPVSESQARTFDWAPIPLWWGAGTVQIDIDNKRVRFGKCVSLADGQ